MIVVGIFLCKALTGMVATLALQYPLRIAVLTGLSLAQVGEFSFVLARAGLSANLIDEGIYQEFVAAAVITMLATPFLLRVAPILADGAVRLPLARWLQGSIRPEADVARMPLNDHVVIVGFGLNGRNVARALAAADIPPPSPILDTT